MSNKQADNLLKEATESLQKNQEALATGQVVDLSEFEKIVLDFCNILQGLPIGEATPYSNDLDKMVSSLEELSTVLTARRDEMKDQLTGLSKLSEAQSAYKSSPGYSAIPDSE